MCSCTSALHGRDDLGHCNQPGFFQLFSERLQIVGYGKSPKICENVEYPVVFHIQLSCVVVNEKLIQS
jgi:hypothetical protein